MVLYIGYLLICMVFIGYLWIFMVLYMNIYCQFYKYRYLWPLRAARKNGPVALNSN